MEDVKNFLKAVLEPTGYICITWFKSVEGQGAKKLRKFFDAGDFNGAATFAAHLDQHGWDVFYCTSTLKEPINRKAENVKLCREFKLDIDIDPDDPDKYSSRPEAIAAFEDFRQKIALPMPLYVKSGGGVHVHIAIAEALAPTPMKIIAAKFKAVCQHHGIKADHMCTADVTRILRVPSTHNYKNPDKPRKVVMATEPVVFDNNMVLDAIDAAYADVPPVLTTGVNALSKSASEAAAKALFGGGNLPAHVQVEKIDDSMLRLFGGTRKSFERILIKNETDEGCAQLKRICDPTPEVRQNVDYNEWRAALSIAINCDDGEKMIHVISENGKDYSPARTIEKAADTIGRPQRCTTFNDKKLGVCEKCQHWGKISSPIQLGTYTPLAKATDNIVVGRNKMFDEEEVQYIIPEYPKPYARKEGGGVVLLPEDENKDTLDVCMYDFYAVRRLKARDNYIMQFRVHKPMDGVLEFAVPTGDIGAKDKLQKFLNDMGIMSVDGSTKLLQRYIIWYMLYMERLAEAEYVKEQFGWTHKFKSFVVGHAEYTTGETLFSPPAPEIAKEAALFRKEGTFEDWREAFSSYKRPGAESHAFSALIGFATPLMAFTGFGGVTVNIMNPDSGVGKTVSLYAQLSIWGDPDQKAQMLTYKDTNAAKLNRLGIVNNLPLCVDEMTLVKTDDVSELVFDVSYGRGKNRMNGSSNTERANNAKWSTIVTLSSNTNWTDKIQVERIGSNGEMARLMEIKADAIPGMTKQDLSDLAEVFKSNFGHASEKYIKHMLRDVAGVRQRLKDEIARFDKDVKVESSERYWTAVFACVYLGGKMAKEAGLHDIDMEHMRTWMLKTMKAMRVSAKLNVKSTERDTSLLGEFLTMHNGKAIVAYNHDKTKGYIVPDPPRGEVIMRYEPDEKRVFVTASVLKEYCAKRNVHMQAFLEEQKTKGVFLKETTKRLLQGYMPSMPVRVYVFHMEADTELVPGVIRD